MHEAQRSITTLPIHNETSVGDMEKIPWTCPDVCWKTSERTTTDMTVGFLILNRNKQNQGWSSRYTTL